jgi:hypothetical protein
MLPFVIKCGANLSLPMETNWHESDPIWGPSPPILLAHIHGHIDMVMAFLCMLALYIV